MPTLFTTYSQRENRITASILAVFERLPFALVQQILQAVCEEPERSLLEFSNQPSGTESRPDGVIRASFAYWLETKVKSGAVKKSQIQAHLKALDADTGVTHRRLLVLTPDAHKPKILAELEDERLVWANFEMLLSAFESIVNQGGGWDGRLPSEQDAFLLRELAQFLISEQLVGQDKGRVLVVAARTAWEDYERYGMYLCQPNRSFRPSAYLAFYGGRVIHRTIPKILEPAVERVVLSPEGLKEIPSEAAARLKPLLDALRAHSDQRLGKEVKVIFLSAPDDAETLRLPADIRHDQPGAFTQGQRYVSLESVQRHPGTTSDLMAYDS